MGNKLWDRFAGFEVKKYRTFRSNDGGGFNADLWFNGRKIAEVDDAGNGGMMEFRFVLANDEVELNERVERDADIYGDQYYDGERASTFLAAMLDAHANLKIMRREAKTKTLFQVDAEIGSETYLTIKAPYTEITKAKILARYQGKTIRFINDEL